MRTAALQTNVNDTHGISLCLAQITGVYWQEPFKAPIPETHGISYKLNTRNRF
jgi:hypothetical protein